MASDSIFLIDIDKILRDKAGRKAKRIPRFFVSYLKHIVHQEEINTFLKSVTDKSNDRRFNEQNECQNETQHDPPPRHAEQQNAHHQVPCDGN